MDFPSKKRIRMTDNAMEVDEEAPWLPNYALLPDVVLIEIFRYLDPGDKYRVGRVCSRWYLVSRSAALWKTIDLQNMNFYQAVKIIPALPPSITYLRLHCQQLCLPLWLPEIMRGLHNRCPSLETFVLENVRLEKHLCNMSSKTPHNLPETSAKSNRTYFTNYILNDMEPYAVLPQLCILSIRRTEFNVCHFFSYINASVLPKIKILDLTYSAPRCYRNIEPFSVVSGLEELYLTGWSIDDLHIENLLKAGKNLKVLDVEDTRLSKSAISALKLYGQSLEELYLANTHLEDFYVTQEEEDYFPRLKMLCVRHTRLTSQAIRELLKSCDSLVCIDVTGTQVTGQSLQDLPNSLKQKILFEQDAHLWLCDHFKKRRRHQNNAH